MENGALVISLDFELLWGVFDKIEWRERKVYFQNTRKLIPEILKLFEEYEISCTWATVGMLFNENWDDWNSNVPQIIPEYYNEKLSAYKYGNSIQSKETEEFCFAPNLIKFIKETQGQEIGTHTYSHYYCLEPGQTLESFRADLEKSKKMADKFGINLESLVFPRNQCNEDYLDVCMENGLRTVRTNPADWYWENTQKDSLQQKIFRTGDAYFGLNNKSYRDIPEIAPGITGQKASRLLRPYSGKSFLDKTRLNRIQSEMSAAAKNKEIYHLWWHPHNFGDNPEKNLQDLKQILSHFDFCRKKYNFQSFNMSKLGKKV
ncbi:polysaccharide deacetylase family protein [Salegentibacter salegens]|uniref:Polysaccharide deacetylase n=1 Tax=Salegentibacter salegens TaxID=143223 RepID=A0A1M7HDY5_9FLAO|nr:polysaccharide deacetylase family protein [Salegentibacter salegens]PRX43488.1 polysaccharide deacetylase [Salegentibacter salegens]SHM26669.1 Polysaccharide deacetylase [Salegentibacter salegens]